MFCFGRTLFLAVLLIWGAFAAVRNQKTKGTLWCCGSPEIPINESSCTDRNQTTQNSSSPMTQVNTTMSVQMGKKALLCCPSSLLTKALLITWEITPRGRPSCIIAYRVETRETNETNCLGKSITWVFTPDLSPYLQISSVALQHEGQYSCEIVAPEGNFQKVYDLQVLVPPEVTYFPGENRTAVCEAIAGKPAAQISWTPDGDCVTKNELHSNGTVTVRSTCHWKQNNVSAVSCWVYHSTGNQTVVIELSRGEKCKLPKSEATPAVEESQVMGTKALLCCPFISLTKAVLITWIITPRGRPSCIIAYRVETRETNGTTCLGRSITWASTPDLSPDLQISAVTLQHEGHYLCDIVTPEGNFQKVYDLQVLVPPEVTYFPGENRTAVCEAISGKPAAQISWTPDGDCVTKNESHSNGTVTVRSTCHWEQNNVSAVSCCVYHSTGNQTVVIELSRGENVNCQNPKLLQLLRREALMLLHEMVYFVVELPVITSAQTGNPCGAFGPSCVDRNQPMQKGLSPMAEVNTTVSVQMGTKALLCCPFIPLTKAVLITWIIIPRGRPSCIIAYRVDTRETNGTTCLGRSITWASTPDLSPDLQISAVALQHEGHYLCDIVTPEGNFQNVYDLQVLVPPEVTYFPGGNRTAVCEAISGKPAAQISWTPDGDCVTKNELHSNGTVTVRSTCHWEQNNVSAVSCWVYHSTGNQTMVIELNQGTSSTLPSLLIILYMKMALLGIILLIVGFAFFQKSNYTRVFSPSNRKLMNEYLIKEETVHPYYRRRKQWLKGKLTEDHNTNYLKHLLFNEAKIDSSCSIKGLKQETEDDSSPFLDGNIFTDAVDITVEMENTKAWLFCPPILSRKATLIISEITPRDWLSCRLPYRAELQQISEKICADRGVTGASRPQKSPYPKISSGALKHDGNYSCQIGTTDGIFRKRHGVQVLGKKRAVVCEEISGKPAAQIFWTPDGDCVTKDESHGNGTVTVRSTCHWEQRNGHAMFCFISHLTGNQIPSVEQNRGTTSILPFLLSILYVKLAIILLIIVFAFFQKRHYFRTRIFRFLETH
ncbi:Cell surface glycoprotein CD200 receptor 2 [Apodemus speciosus]|uniref:Cell surface glycoprotein CD200 receptor 2 n=1 Tax=Apodemus speciosus TaxID=105296 RepID=A0ABQ0FM27_APOSI